MGYFRAGFDVVGIDNRPQPRYPFPFIQADALNPPVRLSDFDAIHASPPCQAYSRAQKLRKNQHPDLIAPTREMLQAAGRPYIIENVPGAPLRNPLLLCGTMFDLKTYRHRLFETSFEMPWAWHPAHGRTSVKMGRAVKEGDFIQVVGNFSGAEYARRAMGTPWMTKDEMREAIPPAFTEWIGLFAPRPVSAQREDTL